LSWNELSFLWQLELFEFFNIGVSVSFFSNETRSEFFDLELLLFCVEHNLATGVVSLEFNDGSAWNVCKFSVLNSAIKLGSGTFKRFEDLLLQRNKTQLQNYACQL